MRIAVLAWGSLIWDSRELAVVSGFEAAGPCVRLEFSRISRDGRLTLVLDEEHGQSCVTYAALSANNSLDDALQNLWNREGFPDEKLPEDVRAHGRTGWVDILSDTHSQRATERHPRAVAAIKDWAKENNYTAAIWTALGSNFHDSGKAAEPFSVDAAIRYLDRRDKLSFARALHYIWSAPPEVDTPLRRAVNQHWARKG